jgi:hypothetical protein
VLSIVVTTGEEALAKRGVVRVEVLGRKSRIRREIDCRDGKRARGVDHGDRSSLEGGGAETMEEGMVDGRFDEDGAAAPSCAGRMVGVVNGVED